MLHKKRDRTVSFFVELHCFNPRPRADTPCQGDFVWFCQAGRLLICCLSVMNLFENWLSGFIPPMQEEKPRHLPVTLKKEMDAPAYVYMAGVELIR